MHGFRFICLCLFAISFLGSCASRPVSQGSALVLTTDFGVKDGAVSAMKGVAYSVSPNLLISDLTHEVPPFDIWTASFRLAQTFRYWPAGTVFVTVVDPGVGSSRRSVVARTRSGHYFVGPDNGHLTLVADDAGIESVRVLNENLQRRRGSEESYTFHGRDLYVYVGARLASAALSFNDCGPESSQPLSRISYQAPEMTSAGLRGTITVLDPNYGNVWSNIPKRMVVNRFHGAKTIKVRITRNGTKVFEGTLPLVDTFASVPKGQGLLYFNSLMNLSVALNQDSFARRHHIGSGPDWGLSLSDK